MSIEQLAKHESIDRGLVPGREFFFEIVLEGWYKFEILASQVRRVGGLCDGYERPMGLVLSALSDPFGDQIALDLGDRFAGFWGGHDRIGVIRQGAIEDCAGLRVSRKKSVCIEGCLAIVES